MTTLDELLDKMPKREREAVIEICETAGTYDADWEILKAAAKLLIESREKIEVLEYRWNREQSKADYSNH